MGTFSSAMRESAPDIRKQVHSLHIRGGNFWLFSLDCGNIIHGNKVCLNAKQKKRGKNMGYVIIGAVIGAFVAVVFTIAKKDSKERDEMVSKLSDEQKDRIMAAEPEFVEQNAWVQEAMVAKMTEKGSKYDLRLLWYNKTLGNNEQNTITIADASVTKAEKEEHDVKVGDFVKLYIAPEKTVGSVKVVF